MFPCHSWMVRQLAGALRIDRFHLHLILLESAIVDSQASEVDEHSVSL